MGFGSGPFGSFPFGSWPWSKEVLFELLPQLYRSQDLENGDALQRYTEALSYSYSSLKEKIDNYDSLRDPFTVQTQYTSTSSLLLGKVKQEVSAPEQFGINGSVTSLGEFFAPTARFSEQDQGKELTISGSSVNGNNRKVTIFFVIDNNTVTTDPILATDSGPLRWELRTPQINDADEVIVEVRSGDISPVNPGWVLSDGSAEFEIIGRKMFINYGENASYLNEQEGTDGAVVNLSGTGGFTSPSVRFSDRDVGKRLVLLGPEYPAEQNVFITRVVNSTQVAVSPALSLTDGPFTWALLGWGELTLSGKAIPKGVVEQDGIDLQITAANPSSVTVVVPSAVFTTADIGKYLTWRKNSDSDNATLRITAIVSSTSVTTAQKTPNVTVDAGPFYWELRTGTGEGADLVSVEAHTPSILAYLSQDFAIEVDSQESELRQRRWVAHCGQWMDRKGTVEGYEIIGKVSGADITVEQLYRVSASAAPPTGTFEVAERTGTDGTLSIFSLRYRFSTPTGAFTVADIGKTIKITGAAVGGNNKYYTIDSIVSTTTVELIASDVATLPDGNNGSLVWTVLRLYTSLPPLRPRFDEINSDILSSLVTAENGVHKEFVIDAFCWEEDFSATVAVEITNVTTVGLNEHDLIIRGVTSPIAPEVVAEEGRWVITSMDGTGVATTGTISGTAPNLTFTAAASMFAASDVGKYLRLDTSGLAANEGVFLITSFVSPTVVTYFNGIGSAEAVTGTFTVYTPTDFFLEEVPTKTGNVTTNYSGTGDSISNPGVDNFCVLTDAAATFGTDVVGQFVRITATTNPLNTGLFEVVERPSATTIKFHNVAAIVGVAETSSFSYTIGFPFYATSVKASVAPEVAPAKLTYDCAITPSCNYCASYRLRVTISPKDELYLEGTQAVDRLFERIERRLREVTPAHVELVIVRSTGLSASVIGQASTVGNGV